MRVKCLAQENNTMSPPGARFSKAPETFRACKAIFSSSVSKNGEMHTPDTSCMKRTSVSRICEENRYVIIR